MVPIESPCAIFCQSSMVPVFYRFRDIMTYWSKICVFSPFVFSVVQSTKVDIKNQSLVVGTNRMILRSLVLSQYQLVTDGRTDRRRGRRTDTPPTPMSRSSIAARDENEIYRCRSTGWSKKQAPTKLSINRIKTCQRNQFSFVKFECQTSTIKLYRKLLLNIL